MGEPTILATSGGTSPTPALGMPSARSRRMPSRLSGAHGHRPRVTTVGTAMGDQRHRTADSVEAAREAGFEHTDLALFPMPNLDDMEGHLSPRTSSGSTAGRWPTSSPCGGCMRARRHPPPGLAVRGRSGRLLRRLDLLVHRRHDRLVRADPATGHHGPGFPPHDNGVHYDSEAQRRPLVHEFVASGVLQETHCTDDGVGLLYHGDDARRGSL